MKSLSTISLMLIVLSAYAQDAEIDLTTKIKKVTVFLEGAQVTRQSSVNLRPGVSLLKLSGISSAVQEQSIQVEGTSGVKILSVSFKVNYLNEIKKPEKIAQLESERRKWMAQLRVEQSQEEVFKEEEAILKTNKSIGGTAKGVDIEELKVAMDYFRQRLTDIKQQLLTIDKNIRKCNEEIGKIEAQLKEMSNAKDRPSGEMIIKVSSKTITQSNLTINYLVKEAKWFPSYDIRAKDILSPVNITYKANVSQHSGEDWENVELTISSSNPNQGGAKPTIKPWYLGFNNYSSSRPTTTFNTAMLYGSTSPSMVRGRVTSSEDGSSLPGVNVVVKGTTVGTVTDAEGFYSIPLTSDAKTLVFSFVGLQSQEVDITNRPIADVSLNSDVTQLSEVVVTGYGAQERRDMTSSIRIRGTSTINDYSYTPKIKKTNVASPVVRQMSFEFTIDEPFSVKSDGEVRSTEMVEYELDALYEYYCVPKLEADAFLVAKVLGWDEYNFLEGEASLFFEGKFIGKSVMDTRNMNDTLTLSLGRDANVMVKREKVKQLSSQQFVGSNQKSSYTFDISIRNKKSQPIFIVVEDQIPVPNTKEISVDKIEDTKAEYDDESGKLKWKRTVAAGKTENIKLSYSVRFPKGNQMLLE